jgi:hypothetical protein
MAVMSVLEFAHLGHEKYDALLKELGLDQSGAKWPDGILSHTAGKTAGGWCVVDVGESESAFEEFRATRLSPAFERVGGIPEPCITAVQVRNRHPATAHRV